MRTTVACDQARAWLVHLVVGERLDGDVSALEAHLSACPACAQERAQLQDAWARQALWEDAELPSGALAPVHAAIRLADLPRQGLRGATDAALAVLALWGIGHLVPLSTLCATCHQILRATPLGQYAFFDELLVGAMLAMMCLTGVMLVNRLAGRPALPARLWAMGMCYALLAGVGAPVVRFVVAPVPNTVAWAVGCLLGATASAAAGRLAAPRWAAE